MSKAKAQVPETPDTGAIVPKGETGLSLPDSQIIDQIRMEGGSDAPVAINYPSFKLEHTTDMTGEPNPLKGHFTLSRKDELGNWNKTDLGESVRLQFLLQRNVLFMVDKDTKYTTSEFDRMDEIIPLFKRVGDKTELVAEATPEEHMKRFLAKNDKGQVYSKLKRLYVLYAFLGGEVVKWKTNMSGTVSYSRYAKSLTPFAVITELTREEKLNGTNKYYVPILSAVETVTNFEEVLNSQRLLRDTFPKRETAMTEDEIQNVVNEVGL